MKFLRCNDGDIALVIHEERGREADIGRFVWVYGPPRVHPELGVVWGVASARTHPLQVSPPHRAAGRLLLVPDAWLLSVRCRLVRYLRPQRTDMLAESHRPSAGLTGTRRRP